MTPEQYEGAILGYVGAFLLAALVVIGYLWAEWTVSAEDRKRRRAKP